MLRRLASLAMLGLMAVASASVAYADSHFDNAAAPAAWTAEAPAPVLAVLDAPQAATLAAVPVLAHVSLSAYTVEDTSRPEDGPRSPAPLALAGSTGANGSPRPYLRT